MTRGSEVDIALATYQGRAYLAEQIASLAGQTQRINQVIARDDGSNDGTIEILLSSSRAELPISVLSDSEMRLGPSGNFSKILTATNAPYVALCDQDDVWDAVKLERMLSAMKMAESADSSSTPVLVCSDLRLIDPSGHPLSTSYWRHQHYDPQRAVQLASLLVMNCFPGCSMMANRALLQLALPIPPAAVMHDWWIAQVAAATGQIVLVTDALISYRIHAGNAVGISRPSGPGTPSSDLEATSRRFQSTFPEALIQAKELEKRLSDRHPAGVSDMLGSFCRIDERGWIGRRLTLIALGVGKHGILRQINLLLHM